MSIVNHQRFMSKGGLKAFLAIVALALAGTFLLSNLTSQSALADNDAASLSAAQITVTKKESGYKTGTTTELDRKVYHAGDEVILRWKGATSGSLNFVVPTSIKVNGVEKVSTSQLLKIDSIQEQNSEYKRRMGTDGTMTTYRNLENYLTSQHEVSLGKVSISSTVEITYACVSPVYRLYNIITSEHMFSTNKSEYDNYVELGEKDQEYWIGEGIDWLAPYRAEGTYSTVHRLYNAGLGAMGHSSHYYTADATEMANLINNYNWTDDGTANQFVSGGSVAIYTCYNEALGSAHHYTSSKEEWTGLEQHQWALERDKNGVQPKKSPEGVFQAVTGTSFTFSPNYYKVNHQLQNASGNGYVTFETQYVSGTAGQMTSATANNYPGYTMSSRDGTQISSGNWTEVNIKYDRNPYFVTYDANGVTNATNMPAAQSVKYGTLVTASSQKPTATNKTFVKWTLDAAGKVEASGITMPIGGIKLYAQWKNSSTGNVGRSVSIKYVMNNSQVADRTVSHVAGTVLNEPNPPTASGWTFRGWYEDANLQNLYEFGRSVDTNLTLYAKWTRYESCTTDDSGKGSVDDPSTQDSAKLNVLVQYDHDNNEGTAMKALSGARVEPNEDGTIYIILPDEATGHLVRATFTDNNGKGVSGKLVTAINSDGSVRKANEQTNGAGVVNFPANVAITGDDGKTSVTDTTSNNRQLTVEVTYRANEDSNDLVGLTGARVELGSTNQIMVFVPQEADERTVSVKAYYETTNTGYSSSKRVEIYDYDYLDNWAPRGGTGKSINPDKTNNTATFAYYVVKFDTDGGDRVDTQRIYEGGTVTTPATPEKSGATFLGWYDDSEKNTAYDFDTVINADRTIYAKFKNVEYTITYFVDGSFYKSQTVVAGNRATEVEAPTKAGYTFDAWYTDETFTTKFDFTAGVQKSTTVYANWTSNSQTQYSVVHVYEALSGVSADAERVEIKGYGTTGQVIDIVPIEKLGFTKTSGANYVVVLPDGTGKAEVYYSRVVNSAEYFMGDNALSISSTGQKNIKFGASLTEPTLTLKDGFKFDGWFTDASFNNPWDFETDTMPDTDVQIYAKVTPKTDMTYSVKHVYEGLVAGEEEVVTDSSYTGTTGEMTDAKVANKEGFTAPEKIDNVAIAGDGSTVITINYTRNEHLVTLSNGGYGASPEGPVKYKFGSLITKPELGEVAGRTLLFWSYVDGNGNTGTWNFDTNKLPDTTLTLTAVWGNDDDVVYTVVHKFEKVDGSGWDEERVSHVGQTDETTTAEALTRTGFSASLPVTQKVINGDGTTEVEIEYTRNVHKVTINAGNHGKVISMPDENQKFGSVMTPPTVEAEAGYEFDRWTYVDSLGNVQTWDFANGMPDNNIEITATWKTRGDTPYTVNFYEMDTNGNYPDSPTKSEVRYGTTESTTSVTAAAKTGFEVKQIEQVTITGDGNAVVRVNYERLKYAVTFSTSSTFFKWESHGTVAYETVAVYYGAKIEQPEVTPDEGWQLNNSATSGFLYLKNLQAWKFDSDLMPAEPVELVVSWAGRSDTKYTVVHKKESFTDNEYPYYNWSEEVKQGTTGEKTSAVPYTALTNADYVGFTAQTPTQVTITGDGKAQVEILYKRNTWNVSWDLGGGVGESTTRYDVKYGSTLVKPVTPTRVGYNFSGWKYYVGSQVQDWNFDSTTMPDSDVKLYAEWTAREDTKYTVKHYLQNVEKTGYEENTLLRENKNGTTGKYVTATEKVIEGFTRVKGGSEVVTGYILADGTLELKVYYDRDSYDVTFNSGDHGSYTSTEPLVYGSKITKPSVTEDGWTLSAWTYDDNGTTKVWDFENNTVPANGVTLTAVWVPNTGTAYKVIHKQQSIESDDTFVDFETEELKGTTGEPTKATPRNYPGFSADEVKNVAIDGSGNTVVEIKYFRNTRTITLNLGSYAIATPNKFENVKYGSTLTFDVTVMSGYELEGWYKDASHTQKIDDITKYTVPDTNEILYANIIAKSDTRYQVRYELQSLEDESKYVEREDLRKDLQGTTGTAAVVDELKIDGFTSQGAEIENIAGDGSTVITVKYTRNKHAVTFVAGEGASVDVQGYSDIKFGAKISQPNASKSAYDLVGWYEDLNDDSTQWNFSSSTMVDRNVTLYAKWKLHNDTLYQIKHSFETMTSGVYVVDESKTQDRYGAANDSISKDTVREAALQIDKQVQGFAYDESSYPYLQQVGAKVTTVITVKHKRLSYNINFDGGSKGTFNPNTRSNIKFGSTVTAPTIQPYPGYYFDGWYSDASLNNKIDLNSWTMPGHHTTIYAKFSSYGNTEYTVLHKREGLNDGEYPTNLQERVTQSGYTDAQTDAKAKDYEGWTVDTIGTGTIAGDGKTVIEITYKRNKYDITFDKGNHGTEISKTTDSQVKFESKLTAPTVTAEAGYHLSGWQWSDGLGNSGEWDFENSTLPAKNITITPLWASNTDTKYKVEHYQQKVDGSGYDLIETVEQTGTTEDQTNPNQISYTGFSYEKVENVAIAGDGSAVAKVYYKRNTYKLNFGTNNSLAGSVNWTACGNEAVYGATLGKPDVITNDGYTFAGFTDQDGKAWDFATNTIPDKDVTITANWTKNANTAYVVLHWFESPTEDNVYPSYLVQKFERTGETESMTDAHEQTNVKGFKVVSGWTNETIKGDGTTAVNIYYKRNAHTVTFNGGGQKVTPETQTVKYETAIPTPQIENKVGYTLAGWFTQEGGKGDRWTWGTSQMPDNAITLYAYWTPNQVSYTVAHRYPSVDGKSEIVEYVTGNTATADTTITVEEKAKEGFKVDSSTLSGTVAADGNTTINVKYTRNTYNVTFNYNDNSTPTKTESKLFEESLTDPNATREGYKLNGWKYKDNSGVERYWDFANGRVPAYDLTLTADWSGETTTYKVKHQQENANDNGYKVVSEETRYGKAGEMTTVVANTYDGFTAVNPNNVQIQPNGATEIVVSYTRNTYDVKYVVGNHGTISTGLDAKVKWGTKISAFPSVTPEVGYTTDAYWYRDPEYKTSWVLENDTVPIGGVTLYKKIVAKTNIQYTVKHLVQSLNDDNKYEEYKIEKLSGTTGLMTSAKALNDAGLTAPVIVDKPIAGNGSTVIELQYNRKSFSVTFKDGSDLGNVYTDKGIASVKYGATINKPSDPSKTGGDYRFDGWFFETNFETMWNFEGSSATTMPARDVTLYAKFYDLNDTPYTVLHKYEKIDPANGAQVGWDEVSETLMGQVGKSTKASLKPKAGFYHSNPYNGNINQQFVQSGGTTVVIEYMRHTYNMYYKGGANGGVPLALKTFKFGQTTSDTGVYPYAGYTFVGWKDQDGNDWSRGTAMPSNTVTLTAQYKAQDDIAYTVVHKREGTTEGTWLYESTTQYGTTGTNTAATAKTGGDYAGFDVSATEAKSIAGNGSTSVTITYMRKKHTVTLSGYDTYGKVKTATFEQKYGTTISRPEFESTTEGWSVERWTYNGSAWNFSTNVMPNENIELKAEWGQTRFKVYFTTDQINVLSGTTGAVTFIGKDNKVPAEFDGLIKVGGYKSNYWCEDKNGTGTQYKPGDPISFNFDYQDEEVTLYAIWNTENLDFSQFTIDQSAKTYTGSQITPEVTSTKYVKDTDYKVTYAENRNVGKGTITITGFGYYMGEQKFEFDITQKPVKVSGISAKNRTFADKNTDAELDLSGVVIDGRVEGDDLGITATGKFADDAVADNKEVTISNVVLTGAQAGNYKIESHQLTTQASITGTYYNVYFHGNGANGTLQDYRQKRSIYDTGEGLDRLLKCDFVKSYGDQVYGFKYWTTEQNGGGTKYEDRYQGHITDRNDNQDVHLYAQWTDQPLGGFWFAESKTITTNNTSAAGTANATYNKPEYSVLWTQSEVEANVNMLINQISRGWTYNTVDQFETNYIKVFTDMMKSDEYHLYTKKNGTSGSSENDYVEFRIIQVGEHDKDGTSLTFQSTHAMSNQSKIYEGDRYTGTDNNRNYPGWYATDLQYWHLADGSGMYYTQFNGGLNNWNLIKNVTKGYEVGGSVSNTNSKYWIISPSELTDVTGAKGKDGSSWEAALRKEGSQYAYWKDVIGAKYAQANPAVVANGKKRDGSSTRGTLTETQHHTNVFWLRDSYRGQSFTYQYQETYFATTYLNGAADGGSDRYDSRGVVLCFSVGL